MPGDFDEFGQGSGSCVGKVCEKVERAGPTIGIQLFPVLCSDLTSQVHLE